jgi:hypothetical protein
MSVHAAGIRFGAVCESSGRLELGLPLSPQDPLFVLTSLRRSECHGRA